MGAVRVYPHKTIRRKGEIRIELLQDDSEACLSYLQKQRMRQLLPLPNSTGTGAKNRNAAGIMYGLLRKLPTECDSIENGRAVASDPARLPGAVEPAGFRGRDGLRPMDAARAGRGGERNAVYGASLGGARGAGCGGGVRDFSRVGLRQQGESRPAGRGIEVAGVLVAPVRYRPKRWRISRRPRVVISRARLSRSWTTHFRFSAIFRTAAPSAPPT